MLHTKFDTYENLVLIIENLNLCKKSLCVIKGFSPESIGMSNIDLPSLLEESMTSNWIKLYSSNCKIITYEEFIYFNKFIVDEYEKIYIINNNLYENFYPLNVNISQDVIVKLVNHFDNENDDESIDISLPNFNKYLDIYNNFVEINESYYVNYNDIDIFNNTKITSINFYELDSNSSLNLETIRLDQTPEKIFNLFEEEDYIKLLNYALTNNFVYVDSSNFINDSFPIKNKLNLINSNLAQVIEPRTTLTQKHETTNRNFTEILKKYWGKNSFRKLNIYNFNAIKNGKKIVEEITQEDIISDIVNQAEGFIKNPLYDYRDVFVTAPTGSGKSAMFQIPAIYLAEKYNLITLVISPLIGLMNDQVYNLEQAQYKYAKTINSDISPVQKEEILNEVKENRCHILYLSPESLLARSDIFQLIGDRKIGMIVIDEAHIVTTWGKQFRPDYWYLGDYIKKLRKRQANECHPFLLTTFTATAIYGGMEDMYGETRSSLSMRNPITYLGYVKRDNIEIKITRHDSENIRKEYELDKFDELINVIERAKLMSKKTLIYFPTVRLINAFYDYCYNNGYKSIVAKYHGQMPADIKMENYNAYKNSTSEDKKLIMLATKAFGMGIDIDDIEIVCHFAPTGNVCDYVQEIGRAARKQKLKGEAIYYHSEKDFRYINMLHGLSAIKKYQLVEVIKKVYEIYHAKISNLKDSEYTKKRNSILVDAESFTYIFEGPLDTDENTAINKVKTALLLIQKDFVNKMNFSPFAMRPVPIFQKGFFAINNNDITKLKNKYGSKNFKLMDFDKNIYEVNLQAIHEKSYFNNYTFPQFKYLLYSKDETLDFNKQYNLTSALSIDIQFTPNNTSTKIINSINYILRKSAYDEKFYSLDTERISETNKKLDTNLVNLLRKQCGISVFRADALANMLIATINNYQRNYSRSQNILYGQLYKPKPLKNGKTSYKFLPNIEKYIEWIQRGKKFINNNTKDGKLYLVNDSNNIIQENLTILGFLEAIGELKFKAIGGTNSQIYIYVNQTRTMKDIIERPNRYTNHLLESISHRHKCSVKMLSFLYQNNFNSNQIWNYIEDYFLGIIPEEIKA